MKISLPSFGFLDVFCAIVLIVLFFLPRATDAATFERIRYYVPDHAGSPMRVVTPEGFVTAKYRYAPLGEQLSDKAASGNRARLAFVGGLQEKADLLYLKHRYYNPLLGRFYQPDPVGFLSAGEGQINRYVYGHNDAYSYSDADGRVPVVLIPLVIWALDNLRSDAPSPENIPPSGVGDAAVLGYGFASLAVAGSAWSVPASGAATADFFVVESGAAITNPVPYMLARVVPGNINPSTLGAPGAADVFVANASELQGLTSVQIAQKLTIPVSYSGFRIFEFPFSNVNGIASPVFRNSPGFVGGGRTAGGASEFVIPNGPIPAGAIMRTVP